MSAHYYMTTNKDASTSSAKTARTLRTKTCRARCRSTRSSPRRTPGLMNHSPKATAPGTREKMPRSRRPSTGTNSRTTSSARATPPQTATARHARRRCPRTLQPPARAAPALQHDKQQGRPSPHLTGEKGHTRQTQATLEAQPSLLYPYVGTRVNARS
jgi:hypothetical protein